VVQAGDPHFDGLKALSALPSGLAAAIQKIRLDPKTGAVTGIDLHSKNETGNTLLRSVGGLVDRREHGAAPTRLSCCRGMASRDPIRLRIVVCEN
jgi:hypothetical protein